MKFTLTFLLTACVVGYMMVDCQPANPVGSLLNVGLAIPILSDQKKHSTNWTSINQEQHFRNHSDQIGNQQITKNKFGKPQCLECELVN